MTHQHQPCKLLFVGDGTISSTIAKKLASSSHTSDHALILLSTSEDKPLTQQLPAKLPIEHHTSLHPALNSFFAPLSSEEPTTPTKNKKGKKTTPKKKQTKELRLIVSLFQQDTTKLPELFQNLSNFLEQNDKQVNEAKVVSETKVVAETKTESSAEEIKSADTEAQGEKEKEKENPATEEAPKESSSEGDKSKAETPKVETSEKADTMEVEKKESKHALPISSYDVLWVELSAATPHDALRKQQEDLVTKWNIHLIDGGLHNSTDVVKLTCGVHQKSKEKFQTIIPILCSFSSEVIESGETGAGQAVKWCSSYLKVAEQWATAEVLLLLLKLGVQPSAVQLSFGNDFFLGNRSSKTDRGALEHFLKKKHGNNNSSSENVAVVAKELQNVLLNTSTHTTPALLLQNISQLVALLEQKGEEGEEKSSEDQILHSLEKWSGVEVKSFSEPEVKGKKRARAKKEAPKKKNEKEKEEGKEVKEEGKEVKEEGKKEETKEEGKEGEEKKNEKEGENGEGESEKKRKTEDGVEVSLSTAEETAQPKRGLLKSLKASLVVFDCAGTTVDEGQVVYVTLKRVLRDAKVEVDEKEFDEWHGANKIEVIRHFVQKKYGSKKDDPSVEKEVQSLFGEFIKGIEDAYFTSSGAGVRLFPGVIRLFDELRSHGIKVALNTGYPARVCEKLIQKLELSSHIDGWITAEQVKSGRPYPYMIHKLVADLGLLSTRTVIKVGDTVRDMEEGRYAGCGLVVGVLTGADTPLMLSHAGADLVLPRVSDLAGFI